LIVVVAGYRGSAGAGAASTLVCGCARVSVVATCRVVLKHTTCQGRAAVIGAAIVIVATYGRRIGTATPGALVRGSAGVSIITIDGIVRGDTLVRCLVADIVRADVCVGATSRGSCTAPTSAGVADCTVQIIVATCRVVWEHATQRWRAAVGGADISV
jgi:hypothetical protein